jgi:hypothetical protein
VGKAFCYSTYSLVLSLSVVTLLNLLVSGAAWVVFSIQLFTSTSSALSLVCDRAEIFLNSGYVSYLAVLIGSPGLFRMALMVLGFSGSVVSFLLQYVELLEHFFGIQLVKPVGDSDLENWVTGDGNRHVLSLLLGLHVLLTSVLLVSFQTCWGSW